MKIDLRLSELTGIVDILFSADMSYGSDFADIGSVMEEYKRLCQEGASITEKRINLKHTVLKPLAERISVKKKVMSFLYDEKKMEAFKNADRQLSADVELFKLYTREICQLKRQHSEFQRKQSRCDYLIKKHKLKLEENEQ